MHGTTLAAVPPFTYWSPDSLKAMKAVRKMRATGIACYFTMDAGPNVKVLCQKKMPKKLKLERGNYFGKEQLITAFSGNQELRIYKWRHINRRNTNASGSFGSRKTLYCRRICCG